MFPSSSSRVLRGKSHPLPLPLPLSIPLLLHLPGGFALLHFEVDGQEGKSNDERDGEEEEKEDVEKEEEEEDDVEIERKGSS